METFAQAIVETVREPLLFLDGKLRVRSANSSFYEAFHVLPEETEDRLLYELGDGQWDIPKLRTLLESILPQSAQVEDFEVEHDFLGIGRRTMLLNARRLLQLDGGPEIILLAIEDMTMRAHLQEELSRHCDQLDELVKERTVALRRANAQLRHDNAMRKQMERSLKRQVAELDAFTYSVSHDLKEPLRAIEAFSKVALEDCADRLDEQGRDYLMEIADASIRMKDLIDELLNLSRAFLQPGPPRRIDVGGLVGEIIAEMQITLDAKRATVEVEKGLPDVLVESTRIRQVFVNLIGNAVKFNESERPHVNIGVRSIEGGMATFYVQDNGIGIDRQYHERIFGMFERLNRREEYEGTGAGLAVVKRAVGNLGGRIWVESELGAGATFLFTLPLATGATASTEGQAA